MSPIIIEDSEDPLATVVANKSSDGPHSLQSTSTEEGHSAVQAEGRKEPVEISIPGETDDSIDASESVVSQEEDKGMEVSGDVEEKTKSKQAEEDGDTNPDENVMPASKINALESHSVVTNPADSGEGGFTSLPETPPSSPSKESCEAESSETKSEEPVVNTTSEAENTSVAECKVLNECTEEREAQSSEAMECKEGDTVEDFESKSEENVEKAMDVGGVGDAGVGGGQGGVGSVGGDKDEGGSDSNTLPAGEAMKELGQSSEPLHNAVEEAAAPSVLIPAEEEALVAEQSKADDQIIADEHVSDEHGVVGKHTNAKDSEEQVESNEPCAVEEQIATSKDSSKEKQSGADGQCIANESTDVNASPDQPSRVLPILPRTPIQEATTDNSVSPRVTPGILKHTSQFDTPNSSTSQGRRVQFASNPVVFKPPKEEEAFRTPRHCTICRCSHTL